MRWTSRVVNSTNGQQSMTDHAQDPGDLRYATRGDQVAPLIRALRASAGYRGQRRRLLDSIARCLTRSTPSSSIAPDHDLDIIAPRQSLAEVTSRALDGLDLILGTGSARCGDCSGRHHDMLRRCLGRLLSPDPGGPPRGGPANGREARPVSRRDEPSADRATGRPSPGPDR